MGFILIGTAIITVFLIAYKLTETEEFLIPVGVSVFVLFFVLIGIWGESIHDARFIREYNAGLCYSKYDTSIEILEHRTYHEHFFLGVFYSDSIAKLPFPERCQWR